MYDSMVLWFHVCFCIERRKILGRRLRGEGGGGGVMLDWDGWDGWRGGVECGVLIALRCPIVPHNLSTVSHNLSHYVP